MTGREAIAKIRSIVELSDLEDDYEKLRLIQAVLKELEAV